MFLLRLLNITFLTHLLQPNNVPVLDPFHVLFTTLICSPCNIYNVTIEIYHLNALILQKNDMMPQVPIVHKILWTFSENILFIVTHQKTMNFTKKLVLYFTNKSYYCFRFSSKDTRKFVNKVIFIVIKY